MRSRATSTQPRVFFTQPGDLYTQSGVFLLQQRVTLHHPEELSRQFGPALGQPITLGIAARFPQPHKGGKKRISGRLLKINRPPGKDKNSASFFGVLDKPNATVKNDDRRPAPVGFRRTGKKENLVNGYFIILLGDHSGVGQWSAFGRGTVGVGPLAAPGAQKGLIGINRLARA